MQLLLLSFLLCIIISLTFSDAKHPKPPKTLRSPIEEENQIFGRLLMRGVISPSNDVDGKIKNRKKRRGLRNVVVVPP